jgi:predicted lipoprotein
MSHLDDLYEMLEIVDNALLSMNKVHDSRISVTDYPDFCLLIADLVGDSAWHSELSTTLRLDATTLNKFAKFRGTVSTFHARAIADRLRSHLRSLDQAIAQQERARAKNGPNLPEQKPFTLTAEQWQLINATSEVKAKIAAVS